MNRFNFWAYNNAKYDILMWKHIPIQLLSVSIAQHFSDVKGKRNCHCSHTHTRNYFVYSIHLYWLQTSICVEFLFKCTASLSVEMVLGYLYIYTSFNSFIWRIHSFNHSFTNKIMRQLILTTITLLIYYMCKPSRQHARFGLNKSNFYIFEFSIQLISLTVVFSPTI